MVCRKCRKELPEGSRFCNWCGMKQPTEKKPKNRGNGTGSVYQRGKTWTAAKTLGYYMDADGKQKRRTVSKGGFKTKKEAMEHLPFLAAKPRREPNVTFAKLYETWEPTHKAGKSTMDCYRSAYKWFSPVHWLKVGEIDIDDLQECLDDCPKGKRTKENMKALCGLMYKYAIPRNLATLNMGQYLVIHAESTDGKNALPLDALERLRKAVGTVPYADYVVAQCYLGFRPSELLALDAKHYNRKEKAFTGGAKTDAGKDRVVTISPKIQPIIDRLTKDKISGPVFCKENGNPLTIKEYRDYFYAALEAVGVENPMEGEGDNRRHKYTPHSCRHTFATMMKNIRAPDKDKLSLIGHTSTEMLRHYQDVDFSALRKITNAL